MINVIVQGPRGGIVKQRLVEEITNATASFGYQLGISRRKLIVAVSVSDDVVTPAGNSGECLEDYYKMPHEREAFKLQRKLVTGYTGE